MKVEQFYDTGLAHASYVVVSEGQAAIIDPARNAQPYYDFAEKNQAKIVAVIETHPHADFVSSHVEIAQKTGATIYVSKLLGATYAHTTFDDGQTIYLEKVQLKSINTPGHSPDSISILLVNEQGENYALFTGDTLFIGDVGRPDLRENVGNLTAKKEQLARQMYASTREKIMPLGDEILVYPAHGAGSLCGKSLSNELFSTLGQQKKDNYALQEMSEVDFVNTLLADQPFIPKYFGYDVLLNKKGAKNYTESINAVPRIPKNAVLEAGILVIDTRPQAQFKQAHLPKSINLMDGGKFETWLGSVVSPDEKFYLIAENEAIMESVIAKTAKIGYESNIAGALTTPDQISLKSPVLEIEEAIKNPEKYTILDIRNPSETAIQFFKNVIKIPLPTLRERINEIPKEKPILVHCAGGYRSAAGSSILEPHFDVPVYDLSEAVMTLKPITS